MKKIFILATPIGNISDVSHNLISKLKELEIFFCEDTRVTKKLFNLLDISISGKKFISINKVNEVDLVGKINFSEIDKCALMSDAGYPIISDPGFILLKKILEMNWEIEVINGPSSIMHSLVVSGLPCNRFYFFGFLSKTLAKKKEQLYSLQKIKTLLIIFESVHKIKETLNLIANIFSNKNICIAKELTKKHETIYRLKTEDLDKLEINLKGEFVILIDNNEDIDSNNNEQLALLEVSKLIDQKVSLKDAVKLVAYKYDLKVNYLYGKSLQLKKNIV